MGGGPALATRLRELGADAGRFLVPLPAHLIDLLASERWLVNFHLLNLEWYKSQAFHLGSRARRFGDALTLRQRHWDVNILEDLARRNAEHAVGRFDEVVAFPSTMLAAEVVDEAESGIELLGVDQKAGAVRLPFL